jgi:hypothetical protein
MSEKNENFHRLARRRVDAILDAMRIFSNLSGPSYLWTPAEVEAYVDEINRGVSGALDRFKETKHWRDQKADTPSADVASETTDVAGEVVDRQPEPAPRKTRTTLIEEIMAAKDTPETLAETIAMQREVIERMQSLLDKQRKEAA